MNKCSFEPASLIKEGSFIRATLVWTTNLIVKNASFHILRVAILIYKFQGRFFIAYIQDYV